MASQSNDIFREPHTLISRGVAGTFALVLGVSCPAVAPTPVFAQATPTQEVKGKPAPDSSYRDWSGVDVADIVIAKVTTKKQDTALRYWQRREYPELAPYTVTYNPQWREPGQRGVVLNRSEKGRGGFSTVSAEGTRRVIPKGMYFEFASLDGKTIYATRPNAGLFAMNFDGTNLRRITSHPVHHCQLSPDGKHILAHAGWKYYPSQDRYYASWDGPGTSRVVMRTDGTGLRTIARNAVWREESRVLDNGKNLRFSRSEAMTALWIRGGKNILLHKGMQIQLMNADGSGIRKIATDVNPQPGYVTFSPSGEWAKFEGGWVRNRSGAVEDSKASWFLARISDGKRIPFPKNLKPDNVFWLGDNLVSRRQKKEVVNSGQKRRLKSGIEVPVAPITETVSEATFMRPETPQQSLPLYQNDNAWDSWSVSPDSRVIAYREKKSRRLGFADADTLSVRALTPISLPERTYGLKWVSGGNGLTYGSDAETVLLTLDSRPASAPVKAVRSLQRAIFASWVTALIAGVVVIVALLAVVLLVKYLLRIRAERQWVTQQAEQSPGGIK